MQTSSTMQTNVKITSLLVGEQWTESFYLASQTNSSFDACHRNHFSNITFTETRVIHVKSMGQVGNRLHCQVATLMLPVVNWRFVWLDVSPVPSELFSSWFRRASIKKVAVTLIDSRINWLCSMSTKLPRVTRIGVRLEHPGTFRWNSPIQLNQRGFKRNGSVLEIKCCYLWRSKQIIIKQSSYMNYFPSINWFKMHINRWSKHYKGHKYMIPIAS